MQQDAIAEATGMSRAYVNEQIGRLKRAGIIVNYGTGWVEFDARLVWRGKGKLRAAYLEVQPIHPKLRMQVFDSSKAADRAMPASA